MTNSQHYRVCLFGRHFTTTFWRKRKEGKERRREKEKEKQVGKVRGRRSKKRACSAGEEVKTH